MTTNNYSVLQVETNTQKLNDYPRIPHTQVGTELLQCHLTPELGNHAPHQQCGLVFKTIDLHSLMTSIPLSLSGMQSASKVVLNFQLNSL